MSFSSSSSAGLHASGRASLISASLDRRIEAVKEMRPSSMSFGDTEETIRKLFDKVELSVSAYDTAWVAMVPSNGSQNDPRFPQCVNWLLDNQRCDGSWGHHNLQYPLKKDALSSTLACIIALKKWGIGERQITKGLQFIELNSGLVTDETLSTPAGFDLIFPGMIEYARDLNLKIPLESATVDAMIRKRDLDLRSDNEGTSKGSEVYLAYCLEGLGKIKNFESIEKYQRKNGSLFNSPATTAAALSQFGNDGCLGYLHSLLQKFKDAVPTVYPFDQYVRLSMVDTLESLGVDRYFKNEIKRVLEETYRCWLQGDEEIYTDIATCALAFRLLHEHGYDISHDLLIPFAEEQGFSESLEGYLKDTVSVLQLFKAAETYPDRSALETQRLWTRQYLKTQLSNWSITQDQDARRLKQEVEDALAHPFYANLERLVHKRKLNGSNIINTRVMKSSYQLLNVSEPEILRFAEEDFNLCQSMHQKELEVLDRWVEENRLQELKFARQKLPYCYFSAAATLFSPELSDARISWAKGAVLTTIIDDFFDVGGSKEEMQNLIHLLERWGLDNIPEEYCSEKVEIIFSALKGAILETGEKAIEYQQRNTTDHVVEIWLALVKSMMQEAEWTCDKSVPTMDDYMRNGYVSFALGPIILPALYLIGPSLSKDNVKSEEFNQMYELVSTIGRTLNDIQGFKRESGQGKLNAVSLRMRHDREGQSQDEIVETMKKMAEMKRGELMKLVVEGKGSVVPREIKEVFLKMSKVLHLFYMKDDGFTSHDLLGVVKSLIYEPASSSLSHH